MVGTLRKELDACVYARESFTEREREREREREIEREREREKREREREREREENQIDIGRDRGLEEKRVVTGIIRWVKKEREEIKVDKIRIRE